MLHCHLDITSRYKFLARKYNNTKLKACSKLQSRNFENSVYT